MARVIVKGLNETNRFMKKLPESINKEIMRKSEEFMKTVQKSAKLRAPRSTGEMANSIKVTRKGKNVTLNVTSPYAIFQEEGYRGHWVHAWLPTKNSLGTIGNALNFAGFMFLKGSSGKHFMRDALQSGLIKLPNMLKDGAKNAIQNAKKGG